MVEDEKCFKLVQTEFINSKTRKNKAWSSIVILHNMNFGREKSRFEFQLSHYWLCEHRQKSSLLQARVSASKVEKMASTSRMVRLKWNDKHKMLAQW